MARTMLPGSHTASPIAEDRAAPAPFTPLRVLESILQGAADSVRNTGALYLLLLTLTAAGLILSPLQRSLVSERWDGSIFWGLLLLLLLIWGSTAAGLMLMDEAAERSPRAPFEALRAAPRLAARLLTVVAVVIALVGAMVAAVLGLMLAAQATPIGPTLIGALVPVAVPLLGLAFLVMLTLVGPIAAPAAWFGLSVAQTLAMLGRQLRERLVHALLLSAAVSLMSALAGALVSAVVLAGGRAFSALAVSVVGLPLAPPPFLAALFGQVVRAAPGAPPLSEYTAAAITGASLVFSIGLVIPGAVYLRGLCELFLALRRAERA